MKICIYGAGSIGGLLGAKLAHAGETVALIARGAHLQAIRTEGLVLLSEGEEILARVSATDDPAEAGPQDVVFLTVKTPALRAIANKLAPLLGPETMVVTAMNGVPWWYFYGLEGPYRDRNIACLDSDGLLKRAIEARRLIGCVVYPAAEVVEPGLVRHDYGNRFMLGELDGARNARIETLARALGRAGFKASVRTRIRDDIWVKLWGNLSFNPVSALTQATLGDIAGDPGTRSVIRGMMAEAEAVGRALGVEFGVDIETRIGWTADIGAHKTSMLQDLERGRPMEIDALLTAAIEMGDLVGIETPLMDAVHALVVQRARLAGCYPV
ncbi:MAG: 2-dehydropantoate 2-reductase [Pseudomonadota bacterium]